MQKKTKTTRVNDQVFNDAPMIDALNMRDQYQKVVEDRMLYMAICSSLVLRLGNDVKIHQKEMLLDATIYISMNTEGNVFTISIDGQKLVEEIDGQMELPLEDTNVR